jgi:hypothetical protein
MVIWGLTDVRARGRVNPNDLGAHRSDFTVYTEAGAAFFDGRDPYQVTNPRGWGYLYPPLFAIAVAPLHALAPENQVLVWFAVSVLMAWGCYAECVWIARAVRPDMPDRGPFGPIPQWIGWAAVTAALFPTLNCLQRGQVGIAKLYLLLVGFRLLAGSRTTLRSLLAGCVLAVPIAVKVTPVVIVGCVYFEQLVAAWFAPRRSAALAHTAAAAGGTLGGLFALVLILPACLVGWSSNLHHLDTWWNHVAVHAEESAEFSVLGDSYSKRNQSLANAVCRLGNWAHYAFGGGPNDKGTLPDANGSRGLVMEHPLVAPTLWALRLGEAALLAWMCYRLGRRQDRLGDAAAFGMACAATLVVSAIARGHYFMLLMPAVIFVSTWLNTQRRPRLAIASAMVPVVLVLAHFALLEVAGRVGLLGIGTAVWFAAVAVAVGRNADVATGRQLAAVDGASSADAPLALKRAA